MDRRSTTHIQRAKPACPNPTPRSRSVGPDQGLKKHLPEETHEKCAFPHEPKSHGSGERRQNNILRALLDSLRSQKWMPGSRAARPRQHHHCHGCHGDWSFPCSDHYYANSSAPSAISSPTAAPAAATDLLVDVHYWLRHRVALMKNYLARFGRSASTTTTSMQLVPACGNNEWGGADEKPLAP